MIKIFIFSLSFVTSLSAQTYLDAYFEKISSHISSRDIINTEVSEVDVAWHLDHILKVIINVSESTLKSDESIYTARYNVTRAYVFTTGIIPRGKAKAPASVTPPDDIRTEDILLQIEEAKKILMQLENADRNQYLDHPVFGHLNKRRVKKFLKIHTKHHFKIIRDIIKG